MHLSRRHVQWIVVGVASVAATALLVGCCCKYPGSTTYFEAPPTSATQDLKPPPGVAASDSTTLVEMQGVHFRIDPRLALQIRRLRGRMEPLPGYDVIDFGESESFVIDIATAEVGLTPEDMLYLFNRYVLNYPDAPLSLHAMSTVDGYLVQRGTLHKVVDIPFEMKTEMTATSDGRIRLHPVAMEICGIPGRGLMEALGIELEDLLDLSDAPGMDVEGNDLLADPREFLPPPALRGHIADVRIEEDLVVQIFDSGEAVEMPPPSDHAAKNYMFFFGGTLAFGKLFMVRSDLQIIDQDPGDPLDFFLQNYMEQLVAGHSETMPDAGLIAVFPDYNDIAETRAVGGDAGAR